MNSPLRMHSGVLLTAGLWAVALLLDTGILAVQLSAPLSVNEVHPRSGRRDDSAAVRGFASTAELPGRDQEVVRTTRLGEARLKVPPGHETCAPDEMPPRWPRARRDGMQEADSPVPGPAAPVAVVHRVKPGETLIGIAEGFFGRPAAGERPDWHAVARANSIEPPYTLQVDQEITIPGAGLVRTRAKVPVLPPVEKEAELAVRATFGAEVNLPPSHAFGPLEPGLRLAHPLWEAFPWAAPLAAAAVFIAAALAAGMYAVATAPKRGRTPPVASRAARRRASPLAWGAASGGGMLFVAGGLGVLAAEFLFEAGAGAEVLFGAAAAALTGFVAYLGACLSVRAGGGGGDERMPRGGDNVVGPTSPVLAVRFGAALAILLAGAFVLSMIAGWTTPALRSLALPR